MGVTVDLFGSAYDTKVYIYDEDTALVACNDDFYSDWTSKLENVAVESGVQYFVIVDGYGGDAGEYQIPTGGHVAIAGDAEQPTFMFELGPQDCANVDVLQSVPIGPCSEGTMDILGYPGDIVWFWVGPQTHEAPDGFEGNEYAYRLFLTPPYVAVEDHSLTEVKALFR
jgi:hypothetical protein